MTSKSGTFCWCVKTCDESQISNPSNPGRPRKKRHGLPFYRTSVGSPCSFWEMLLLCKEKNPAIQLQSVNFHEFSPIFDKFW